MEPLIIMSALFITFLVVFMRQFKNKRQLKLPQHDMLVKYKIFIDEALAQGKTSRIERLKANSLSIRTSSHKNASVFSLTEVNGRIIIVWTWSDSSLGRRGKEWSYPETYDQKKMFDEVVEDVINYQTATYQKYNQTVPVRL